MFSRDALQEAGPPALAVAALIVAFLTQFAITEGWDIPRPWLGFVPAALLLAASAFLMARTRVDEARQTEPITLTRKQELLLFAVVIGLAAFFRLWRFYDFPQGIWFDEGVNATDAIFIINEDHFTIWRETVQGRSTVFLYLLAGSFKLFGYNLFALRIVPVVAGIAAVVAFYMLARHLIGVVPALIATALLAVSRWATTFSRISWEASLVPLLEIMSVYFLLRALETRSKFFFFMAGGSLAAGLYTYVAFRIVPLVLLMFLAYIALTQWRLLWRNVPGIALYAASFFVVVAPLAQFALTNQDKVLERTRNVNVFQEVEDRDSYEPIQFNLEANIKMMNVEGDRNGRHNIHREPMVDEITAALFVLGIAVSLWSIRDWRRGGIAIWYVLMLVPAALTVTIENPSGIRAIGAIPPLYLLAGMAVATTYRAVAPMRNGAMIFGAIALLVVGSSTAINYYDLFERQAKDQFVYDGFEPQYRHVGEVVAREGGDKNAYVSRAFDGQPGTKLLTHGKDVKSYVATRDVVFPANGRDVLLIMDITQFSMFPNLQRLYPNITKSDYVDDYGRVFFAEVTIPASDVDALHRLSTRINGVATDASLIDREWTEEDLADGPVQVEWTGYVWVTTFPGQTALKALAPGAIAVEVADQRTESAAGSVEAAVGALSYGEHQVTVKATIERPGSVDLSINTDGLDSPGSLALYATSTGEQGFRALHREDGQFSSPPTYIAHMPFATSAAPINGAASVELQGILSVPTGGVYGFALEGWNSAQLFVDDQLVVDNGGAHAMRRVESEVRLEAGDHVVSIQYLSTDFPGWSMAWRPPLTNEWLPMDGTEFSVPTTPYVPPAIVNLVPDTDLGPSGWTAIPDVERATGVAILPSGEIALASRNRITFMNAKGIVERTVPIEARDAMDIVATDNGHLVVLERDTNSLIILDSTGAELRRITGAIASSGGLGVLGNRVYITSPAGGVVYAMDVPDGEPEPIGIGQGGIVDRAAQPSDIAATPDGTLYLTDFERRNVVSGNEAQTQRMFSGASGTGDHVPRIAVYGDFVLVSEAVAERILIYDRDGKQRGVFVFPAESSGVRPVGMAVADDGTLYVVDLEHARLYSFTVDLPDAPPPVSTE